MGLKLLKLRKKLLTNRQEDIQLKIDVHNKRMKYVEEVDIQLTWTLFQKSMKELSIKNAKKYDFILKACNSVKDSIFELFKNVWDKESEPDQWRKTNIIQIYKGRGDLNDLGNLRNIHTKLDVPK